MPGLAAAELFVDRPNDNLKVYNRGISGHEVFNLVTHRGRQGVVRQDALGNVRQAVHNGVLGKGARVCAS